MAAIIKTQLSLSEGKGRKGEAGGSAPYEYPSVLVGTPPGTLHPPKSGGDSSAGEAEGMPGEVA